MASYIVVEGTCMHDGRFELPDLSAQTIREVFDMPPDEELDITIRANVVLVIRKEQDALVLIEQEYPEPDTDADLDCLVSDGTSEDHEASYLDSLERQEAKHHFPKR